MRKLLVISLLLTSCASYATVDKLTVVEEIQLQATDKIIQEVQECVKLYSRRPPPKVLLVKEVMYFPETHSLAIGLYNPNINIIYLTMPFSEHDLRHELIHWINPYIPHESRVFYGCVGD